MISTTEDFTDLPNMPNFLLTQTTLSSPTVTPRSSSYHKHVAVKPGSSAELPCTAPSNLAQLVWTSNGSALTEASRFQLVGESALLIYSVAPEDQGLYECWSLEPVAALGKNFSRPLAAYILTLDVPRPPPQRVEEAPPTTLERGAAASSVSTEGNGKTDVALLTSALAPSTLTSAVRFTPPPQTDSSLTPPPGSNAPLRPRAPLDATVARQTPSEAAESRPESSDPSAKYLQHSNSAALLSLFLLFFLLFLAALAYNCYMQYLPAPCLRLRAALLGSHKNAHQQPEYRACEAGLMEASASEKVHVTELPTQNGGNQHTAQNLRALRDTGYETEPECGNGQVSAHGDDSSAQEKPFDVDCESQPIQFADADEPYC